MQAEAVPEASPSVGPYLDTWLAHVKGRVRRKTWEGYEGLIRLYARAALSDVLLEDLHPLTLQRLYSSLLERRPKPLSGGTVLNLHLVLTQALSQAVRWGYLSSNPAAGAQPPRPRRKELATVDAAFAEHILSETRGGMLECPVAIAIATGMRRGEICGLRWEDLSGDYSIAQVRRTIHSTREGVLVERPKTPRSSRSVVLPEFLFAYLKRQEEDQERRRAELGEAWCDEDYVLDSGDGSPIKPDNLSSLWSNFLRRKGIRHVRFHDLRHAHATLMLSKGVHPKIVSERLGHASIGITLDTYSHVLPSMQQDAADAFDALFRGYDQAG